MKTYHPQHLTQSRKEQLYTAMSFIKSATEAQDFQQDLYIPAEIQAINPPPYTQTAEN